MWQRMIAYCPFLSVLALLVSCSDRTDELLARKISELSDMSELGTVEYTVKKIISADDAVWYKYGDRKILYSCVVYLKAGIDLFDVHGIVRGLDTMVWSDKDEKQVIRNARRDFMKDALDSGLLEKAESNGIKELEACFKAFGFKFVEFL